MLIQYRIQFIGDSVNISQFVDPDGMLGDATSPGNAVAPTGTMHWQTRSVELA